LEIFKTILEIFRDINIYIYCKWQLDIFVKNATT